MSKLISAKLIIQEANNIKKFATPGEIKKLVLKNFNPTSPYKCIYGLMADHCNSDRAFELIKKCCTKILDRYYNNNIKLVKNDIDLRRKLVRHWYYMTPIEWIILDNKSIGKLIIRYIKGKVSEEDFTIIIKNHLKDL